MTPYAMRALPLVFFLAVLVAPSLSAQPLGTPPVLGASSADDPEVVPFANRLIRTVLDEEEAVLARFADITIEADGFTRYYRIRPTDDGGLDVDQHLISFNPMLQGEDVEFILPFFLRDLMEAGAVDLDFEEETLEPGQTLTYTQQSIAGRTAHVVRLDDPADPEMEWVEFYVDSETLAFLGMEAMGEVTTGAPALTIGLKREGMSERDGLLIPERIGFSFDGLAGAMPEDERAQLRLVLPVMEKIEAMDDEEAAESLALMDMEMDPAAFRTMMPVIRSLVNGEPATVLFTVTDVRVNTGLPDKLFAAPPPPASRPQK